VTHYLWDKTTNCLLSINILKIKGKLPQGEVIISGWDVVGQQQAYYSGPFREELELDITGSPGVCFIQLEIIGGEKRVWKVVKK
jgi:hypothetical protein